MSKKFIEACKEQVNDFLISTGGATAEALANVFDNTKSAGSAFFKPYESTAGFFKQTASVAAAPISLAVRSLEMLVTGIIYIPLSIAEACIGNTDDASEHIVGSAVFLLAALPVMLAAFISPLVNLIDLIGSGCVSIAKACQDKEETAAGYGYGSI